MFQQIFDYFKKYDNLGNFLQHVQVSYSCFYDLKYKIRSMYEICETQFNILIHTSVKVAKDMSTTFPAVSFTG